MEIVNILYYDLENKKFKTQERIKKNFLRERDAFEKSIGMPSLMIRTNYPCTTDITRIKKQMLKLSLDMNNFKEILKLIDMIDRYEN